MKIQCTILLWFLGTGSVFAEVTRIEIAERKPFADGTRFGQVGAYESISGRLFFEVDPESAANDRIFSCCNRLIRRRETAPCSTMFTTGETSWLSGLSTRGRGAMTP